MIPISARYLGVLVLVLGASAGVRVFALADARGPDLCRAPDALKATSLIPGAIALGERLESMDASTIQWSEGDVANPILPNQPMRFQIIRSFDGPSLYGNPLRYGEPFEHTRGSEREPSRAGSRPARRLQVEDLRVREARVGETVLPIHVAWDHTEAPSGPSRLVAWFFAFDNAPVESPFYAQLESALGLALRGPRPLTLVMISGLAPHESAGRVEDAAIAWLEGAWARVAESCAAR